MIYSLAYILFVTSTSLNNHSKSYKQVVQKLFNIYLKVIQKWSKSGPKVIQKWSKSGPKVVLGDSQKKYLKKDLQECFPNTQKVFFFALF